MQSIVEHQEHVLEPALVAELTAGIVTDRDAERRLVLTPLTGSPLAEIPLSKPSDVGCAVQEARSALRAWNALGHRGRAAVVIGFHDRLLRQREDVLDLIQLETGKTRANAFEEVAEVANVARYYSRFAGRLLASRRAHGAVPLLGAATEQRVPRGVVGIITPWNYPFALSLGEALPALLAGNAVVLRPDPRACLSVLWGLRLLLAAGLPAGVAQVVTGDGDTVGEAVARRTDYISFTGSTTTGRRVAQLAAERLVDCSLELGGKNALYVRADAPLGRAVEVALRGAFAGAGQVCVHTERLILHEDIAEELLDRFIAAARGMRLGIGLEYGYDMGSLFGPEQLQRVTDHIADAVRHGARVLTGGRRRPDLGPYVFEPTVLDGVTAAMDVRDAETFGPVVSVYRVRDDEAAVRLINDSDYGLHAGIVSADREAARRLAPRLRTGSVSINETFLASWGAVGASMGARGQSGSGVRHGAEGLRKFTGLQSVAEQRGGSLTVARAAQQRFAAAFTRGLMGLRRTRIG